MTWLYSIIIYILMIIVFITTGEIKIFVLGLEVGVLIGQILFIINESRKY